MKDIQKEQQSTSESLHLKIDDMENKISNNLEGQMKELKDYMMMELAKVNDKLGEMEKRITELERSQCTREPFSTDVSLVSFKVAYSAGEDVQAVAEELIQDTQQGLGLRNVRIVKAERTPMREGRPGIVKIELRNVDDKKAVLRAKTELRKTRKFRHVYIKGAQTHAERLIDLNFKIILNEMPKGDSYRVTGNGRLVKKAEGENVERRGWHNNNRRPPPNEAMQHSPERHDSTASTS